MPNSALSYALSLLQARPDTPESLASMATSNCWERWRWRYCAGAQPQRKELHCPRQRFQPGAISQTINGLIAKQSYTVPFDWEAAQQSGFTGDTTEQFQIGFGSETQPIGIVSDASHSSTAWQTQSFAFTRTAAATFCGFSRLELRTAFRRWRFSMVYQCRQRRLRQSPGLFGGGGMLRNA